MKAFFLSMIVVAGLLSCNVQDKQEAATSSAREVYHTPAPDDTTRVNVANVPSFFSGGADMRDTQTHRLCGTTYRNKDDGNAFQDIRRLTLNWDATFNWKHISCTSRDTSFGAWTIEHNIVYLTT